ncbi:MAG: hypothetical protein R3D51_03545 [Hyphomicrobiaceae bacterium]
MSGIKLETYADWKTCIEEYCRIPLTPEFVASRIAELTDTSNERTRRFVETWGEAHRQRVLSWFQKARDQFAGSNP